MKKQVIQSIPNQSDVVFLKGKKVTLRPLFEADVPFLLMWVNDPDIRQYIMRFTPISEKGERDWVNSMDTRQDKAITVGIAVNGQLIGSIGLHAISWKDRNAEMGILVGDKKNQEKGYGSDAATTLLEYAFDTLNLYKVIWKAKDFNVRSVACAKRCGFKVEARLRRQLFVNGKYCDEVILAIFRDEWVSRRNADKKRK